jgi:hypothetical protein
MAFDAQGVTLRYPSHSWSGVRGTDGAVVIAIRATCIQVDDGGCSCLLWSPAIAAKEWMERASHEERLEHCRLAVRYGAADGLLAYGERAAFDADEVIALLVVKVGDRYWARWGSVARAGNPSRPIVPCMRPAEVGFVNPRACGVSSERSALSESITAH